MAANVRKMDAAGAGGAGGARQAIPAAGLAAGTAAQPSPPPGITPLTRRVLCVVHDPVVDDRTDRRLTAHLSWHDPHDLAALYIAGALAASHGLLRYEIVEWLAFDGFPVKVDGFRYDAATYLRCWRAGRGFHQPDGADYDALLASVDAVQKVNDGAVDEVWLFGGPYAGYYESRMAGPGAFWCNAPPLPEPDRRAGTPRGRRRFVVMGFNYERDAGCMLENLGHRVESIMAQVYAGTTGERNDWQRFTRYDQVAPGRASMGTIHFAPNSTHDYDWGNARPVSSDCDDWLRFPHLTGERRLVDCRDWGGGDMRLHHLWWLERLPHAAGEHHGILHNWWAYAADPDVVRC